MIEMTLDGTKVEVREGSTVMDAAGKLGTYIPHFCYHKKLTIAANCRMCLVEVEKAPKPLPACATPVTAGMVVHTKSAKAIQAQKSVMEFLLINHPLDCPICDQGGECQLQDLAVGYGGSASRYTEEKRVVFHKDVGPLVSMAEMSRCIHCTRCIRFGQEVAGVMELGMLNRGEHSEITTFVGKTVDSELSGNMIDICPVGALTSKPFRYSARTWELSRRKSVSPHDGLGANLVLQVKQDKVLRVLPLENEDINECWVSDRDRFSYEGLNSPERLTRPMLRQDGIWIEVEWEDALSYVAHGLKDIVARHGAQSLGALASPQSTVEELYLLQKIVRGLGSENIDIRLREASPAPVVADKAPWLGMSVKEFAKLDRLLIVGSFLRKDHPLLSARVRQSVKAGGQLTVIHAIDDDLLMPVAGKMIAAPSAWVETLAAVASAIASAKGVTPPIAIGADDAAKAVAASLMKGSKKAILLGNAAVQHPDAGDLLALAQWIARESGAKVGVLTEGANTVGAYLAGAVPNEAGLSAERQFAEPRNAYLLLHAEPDLDAGNPAQAMRALASANMVVAMSPFKHAGIDYADVFLPISPFSETSGTFINAEGRAQSFNGAVKPLGETRPAWKVLRVLGNLLGLEGFDFDSSDAVRDAVTGGATDLSARCSNDVARVVPDHLPGKPSPDGLERIADVPIYFADALVRRAESLQLTRDAQSPKARLNAHTASEFGVLTGDMVHIVQGADTATLPVEIDARVADGVVRIAAAHPATTSLGGQFGRVTLAKASA